ncbi:MAG: homocysteine S-methyltransferase family protein [Oscillospiraceae bacterium]
MHFKTCIEKRHSILMEGALGERLKREFHLNFDKYVMMAKLIYDTNGRFALKSLWQEYINIAAKYELPFLATTPTRRANKERVEQASCNSEIIIDNVKFLHKIQQESNLEMYVGGLMGCRGDAYTGKNALSARDARIFHKWQADLFCAAEADFLYAGIMPTLPEATGMAQAMSETGLPYIISFTIQKDGKLIDGTTISKAIATIDNSVDGKPICYMANCVHPSIVYEALSQPFNQNTLVKNRFLGIQANTSPLSYAELDGSLDLKCSDPMQFAEAMLKLRNISNIKIFGGCCGTDNRHMEQIAKRL